MKVVITTLICLILVSSGGASTAPIVILAGEIVIVSGGISSVLSNTLYLNSDYRQKPSVTAGYIWGGLNLGMGTLIFVYTVDGDNTGGWMAFGIGQMALGVAGVVTSIFVERKPVTYYPTVLIDSEKKPIVGLSVRLRL